VERVEKNLPKTYDGCAVYENHYQIKILNMKNKSRWRQFVVVHNLKKHYIIP